MKPLHAFSIAFLLPMTVLTVVGIAAATAIPKGTDREVRFDPSPVALPATDDDDDDEHAKDKDGLHHHMEALQSGMKEMRRMLGKPDQKDALIALTTRLAASAQACIGKLPEQEAPLADAVAQAEWRIGYQRRMVEVLDTLLQLELATYKDDVDATKALYKKLGEQKQSGHDAYQAE